MVMFLFWDRFLIRLYMFINQLKFPNSHELSKCCHAIRSSSLSFGPSLLIGCQGILCFVPAAACMLFLIGLFWALHSDDVKSQVISSSDNNPWRKLHGCLWNLLTFILSAKLSIFGHALHPKGVKQGKETKKGRRS